MFIETIILAAIAATQIVSAIYIACLMLIDVIMWFQSNRWLTPNDKREIGFTLQKRLANGSYKTVQGVFNNMTSSLEAVRKVDSRSVDQDLSAYHQGSELVVYP